MIETADKNKIFDMLQEIKQFSLWLNTDFKAKSPLHSDVAMLIKSVLIDPSLLKIDSEQHHTFIAISEIPEYINEYLEEFG